MTRTPNLNTARVTLITNVRHYHSNARFPRLTVQFSLRHLDHLAAVTPQKSSIHSGLQESKVDRPTKLVCD